MTADIPAIRERSKRDVVVTTHGTAIPSVSEDRGCAVLFEAVIDRHECLAELDTLTAALKVEEQNTQGYMEEAERLRTRSFDSEEYANRMHRALRKMSKRFTARRDLQRSEHDFLGRATQRVADLEAENADMKATLQGYADHCRCKAET